MLKIFTDSTLNLAELESRGSLPNSFGGHRNLHIDGTHTHVACPSRLETTRRIPIFKTVASAQERLAHRPIDSMGNQTLTTYCLKGRI